MESSELIHRLERIEKLLLSNKKVLNIEEASEYTGYKPSYLYKLSSAKKIPHSKPNGGLIFFNKEKLDNWLLRKEIKLSSDFESQALAYTLKNKR